MHLIKLYKVRVTWADHPILQSGVAAPATAYW
jgi:hypothetical protein